MADIKQDTDTTQQKYEPAAKLYNNLISEGYTPENLGGGVDNFCMRMFNDEGSRRKLYDNLIKEGYTSDNIGEYDDFNASMAVNGMTHNQIRSIVSELRDSRTKAMKELDAYKKQSTYEPRIVTTGGAVAPAAPRQTVEYLPGYEEARQRLWNDENERQYDMYRRAELMLEKSLMRKKTSLQREYADRMDAVDAAAAESGLMKATQGPLSVGGPTVTPQYIPEGASMSEYLKRTAALDMIKNYTTRTDELLKAPLKHESDGAWDAVTDALKGSARGFADIAANPANYPVIGPIVETVRDKQVQALFQKANKGEQLSEEETMAYLSYINYLDAAEKIEPELAMSYKVGRGAAMSTSFALEMMLTGGLQAKGFAAIARSLASHGHKGAAAKVAAWLGDAAAMEKIKGAKAVRSQMNVMEKGLGQTAQDLMQTAMMPSTYSGIVADQTDAVIKGDDYEFKDVIRSLAGSGTEVVTEGTVGKAIDAGLKRTPLKRFVNHFYGSGSKLGRAHTKIQSPISENAEEYAGALMDYIRSYNPMFDEESNAQLREGAMQQFSGEGAAETALTVLLNPLQIAGLGAQGVTDAVNHKTLGNIKKNYDEAEKRIAELIAQTQGVDMNTAKGIIAKSLKAECANMDEVADKLNILSRNLYTLDVENCKAQGIDESVARDRLKKNRDAIRKYFEAYGRYNQVIGAIAEQYNGLSDIQKQEIDNIVDEYRRTHENSIVTEAQDKVSGSVNETNGRVQEVRLFGSEDEEPAKVLRGNVATTTNEQGQTIIDRTASDPIITIEDGKGARQISPSEIMEVTGDASQEEVDAVTRSAEFLEEKNKLDYPVGSLVTTPGADRYSVVVRSDASGVYIATMDENTGEVIPVNISDGNGNISDAYMAVRPEDETPIGKLGGEILTYVGRDEAGNALIRHQDGREESVDANTLASYMENLEPLTAEDLNAVKGSEGAEQAQAQPQPEETGQPKEQTEEERQAVQLESDVAAYDTFASQGDTEYISQNLKEARTALKKAEKDHPTATNMEKRLAQLAEIQKAREDARREVERWERAQAFIDSRDGVKPSPESVETQEKAPQQPKENPAKDSTPLPDAMADSLIQSEGISNAKRAVTVTKTDIKKKIEAERKKLEKIPLTEMSKRTKTKEKIESLNSQLQYWSDVETSLIEKEEAANPSTKAVDLKRLNEEKKSQREKALQDQGFYKPGKIVGEKWDAAPKKEGNTMVKTLADGTTVKGRFILVPAEALTPSHDGLNDYEIMEGAPVREDGTTVNSRDYKNSKDNQALTNNMAVDYDGQAVNDTPVTYRGNVYSGNGRTIAGQIAAAKGTDTKYTEALKANAQMYGFSAEDVDAIPHARLVFELDEEMPYTPEVYAKFNQETMKKESSTEQAVASSKTLSETTAIKIADIIDGYANTDSYFASADAATSTLNMLVEEGVIGANEMPELRDRNGKLTDTGRERITNILLGAMLEEDTIRAISELPSLKQLAVRLAKQLLANRKYKSGSLLPEVNAALRLVASSRKQGYSVQENLKQADLFGQGAADTHSIIEKCLAVSFEEGVDISKDLLDFINQKSADCLGISDIFTGKIYDKQSVADSAVEYYNNVILNKDYGKGRQQRDIPNSGRETADRGAGEGEHLRSGPGGNDGETSEGQEAKSRQRAVEAAVKFASELGVKPVIVRKGEEEKLTRQAQQVLAAGERFTAYYDKARNEVVIYEPYFHTDASKAVSAMAHEIVAHKGLREMLGEERFNTLLDNVWDAMSDAAKDYYASYIYSGASDNTLKKLGLDRGLDTGNPLIARQIRSKLSKDKELTRQAADECIAGYAETQRFDGVVQAIRNFLNKILSAITGEKIELTAQNVERLLQASAQRLRDNAKQQERGEKKEENATTGNNVEEVRPNKSAPRKIEDFGEKIGGARKDVASEIADKINPNGNTFSKVFPKFDMHKLLEKGLDPKMAASLKFCISIAKKSYKQNKKRYGEEKALSAAAFYAAYAKRMLEGETTPVGFTSNGWVFTETGIKLIEANIELYKRLEDIYGEGMHDIDFSDYEISYTIPKPGASLTYSYKDKDGKWQTETIDTPFYTYMSRSNIYKPEKLEDLYKDALEHIQRSVSYDATHKYNIRLYVMRSSGKRRLGVKVGSEIVFLTEEGDYDYGYINEHNAELQALAERKIAEMKAGRKAEGKKAEIDIVSEYVDGVRKYTIAVKLDKQWKSISHYVGSRDYRSLLDYKKEHSDELQEKAQQILDEYEAGKKFKPELNLTQERRRIGDDHRQGHDVSPERFSEVFGFRGVEFGNYVTAKERQQSLNDAFDALLDMADVIGVSPKALSLNGQLSLAFGARGKSSAKAHYEPNKNVINITKTHGAGSLAHEYFHALDYYFGQREKGRTATESKFVDDVRPEVAEAFNSLMETIKKSDYFKRSKALEDLIHPNVVLINGIDPRYYVQPTELGARAFGDYIIRKLSDKGHVNDYLSSFTTVDEWNGNPDVYPFPIDSDAETINKAFDKLFDTIQEKEVEGRRVLFQLENYSQGEVITPKNTSLDEVMFSIKVNHNSPYLLKRADGSFVDKITGERLGFDHRFMGKGEGSQVHGWGSYFSKRDIREYADFLYDGVYDYNGMAASELDGLGDDKERAVYAVLHKINHKELNVKDAIEASAREFESESPSIAKITRSLNPEDFTKSDRGRHHYDVEIPDNDGTNYLEEDDSVSSEAVALIRSALEKEILANDEDELYKGQEQHLVDELKQTFKAGITGRNLYGSISAYLGGDEEASKFLNDLGYVGIHYNGRKDGEGYVIFDERDATITDHTMFSLYMPQEDKSLAPYTVREMQEIKGKTQSNGTFMKAPNGKPTKLSERQWLQVRTRAFKKWFGDWETDQQGSSKIVDENGEPMVMYHGDKAKNRYSFLSDTFFTGDADYAKRYTQGTGEVGSYFLDIKKPFDIRNKEAYDILTSYRGGNLPTKTDSGAMDWVDYDYEDLREYLNEKHPDKYDGFVIDEGADGGYGEEVKSRGLSYVPYSASQIKSATTNNGDFSRENDDVRFQLIGETGAKSLDKTEEASYRMDGLKVARDMEKEGYNAKEVRMATGWERGADNLWRYEVSDISEEDLKNAITKANNEFKRRRFEEDVKEDNLRNAAWRIYDRLPRRLDSRYSDEEKAKFKELRKRADQLFKEASEARERRLELENNYERNGIQITLGDVLSKDRELMRAYPELADRKVLFTRLGVTTNGSYNPETKDIKLNRNLNIKDLYSTLNHEVQHAIQDMEGFASGGSATDVLTSNIKEVLKSDLKKKLELKQQKLTAIESIMKSSGSELKDYAELEGKSVEDAMKSWSEEKKRLQEDKEEIEYMLDGIDKGYLRSDKAHEYYRRIAGEVEARNVQRRLNMSKEERRSTLLKDTEDVAREDQLFIVDNLSDSKSDKENTLFQRTFVNGLNSQDEVFNSIQENTQWSNGAVNLMSALEKYHNGPVIAASSGAKKAMSEGLVPVPGEKFSGEEGEYHHLKFNVIGEGESVIAVPFAKAEDVEDKYGIRFQMKLSPMNTAEVEEDAIRFSLITDKRLIDELEKGEKVKVYRAMQQVDGKLYPPMAAVVEGEWQSPIEIGKWEKADERPELITKDGKFTLNKGNGLGTLPVAYNPYIHTSYSPLNDQFSSAHKRPNLVTVEVEIPASELTSGYKAEGAKNKVGETTWHSGPVASKLSRIGKPRKVVLSRYDKPVRIVPDSEVADMIASTLEGTNISIPANVVTPSLFKELTERGVSVDDNTLFQMKKAPSKYTARDGRTVEFRQLSLFDNSGKPSEQLKEENEDVFRRGYYNLKPGEFSDVERVFTERGYFEFTAKNKIKSPEDVAYIFKQLETESVENSFGVLIDKNGKPYIIHLGIGSSSQTVVDAHALIAAADRVKPQKVYFIHNHPSGSLRASKPDVQTHQALKQALGDVLQDGIIIDTVSGKFVTFNSTSTEKHNMPENQEGAVPVEVHSFSKRVFGKDYDYSGKRVENIYDVASFLSSMRFGQRSKVGMLALTQDNQITANIFIPEKLEKVNPVEIIGKIATFGGTSYILYSNEYSLDRRELGRIVRKIRDAAKPANIREVDIMLINSSHDGHVYIGASQAAGDVAFQLSTSRSRGETLQDLFESSMIENASRIDARGVNGRKYVSNKLGTISKAFTAGRVLAIDAANSIISFAKAVLRAGEIDSVTGTMFSRILGKVEKAVSKTDQRKELEQIFDLLTGQAIATSEKALSQLLKYKVADVNQSGVSIAKNVDSATRVFVERMRDNMKEERATIEARLRELEDKLSAMSESEDKSETEAAIHGLEFALRYKDSVKASHDDIADMTILLRQETKKLVGMRGEQRKRQQEVIASIDANIRETKLQLLKEVDTLCAELTDILNKGMEGRAKWLADTEDHKNAILHYAFSDLQGVKPEKNAKRKSGNWLKEFFTAPIYNLDTMLRSFASKAVEGKGYLYNHFIPACIKASQKEFEGFRLAVKELDAKCAEIWGEGMTYDKVMKMVAREPRDVELEWLKENGETEKQTLTVGQIMYIYMVNKMTDGAMKLRTMEIMEDDVDALKTLLPKEIVRLADWLQDEFLPSRKAEYNKTHRELFGRPMDEVKNYVPLAIASEAIDRKVDVNDSEEQSPMSSTVTGSIIKRRRNNKAIDIANTDAMALILRHLRDMEHWAAFSPVSRDFNTLLSSRLFRNKINAINPDNFRLFKSVAQIATGNYKPKSSRTGMLATKLVKLIGGSKIAFRLNTALKQFLSYPAYWAEVGSTPGFFASLAESTANPYGSVKWCYENLPLFRKRWDSKAAGQEYYNLSDVNWETMFGKAFEKIAKVGMIPNAVVDLIVCSYGAKAMYEAKYKFYIGRGYSEENAKSRAMTDAELVYNLSQQSTEGFAMSALQMDNGIFSRMVSLFNNSSFSYARQFVQGCRGLRAYIQHKDEMIEFRAKQLERDGMSEAEAKKQATVDVERDRTRSVAKVAIYGFLIQAVWNMGGAAWYLLDCAFSDDDDDKQAAVDEIIKNTGLAVVQPVRGLVGGATLESALQAAANSREFDAGSGVHPVVSDASRAAKAVHRIITSQSSNTSDMLEMMNAVLNSGASFVGLQPQTFVNAFDGVSDLVTTNKDLTWLDVRQDLALILNAPPSQINRMALRPRKGETFEEFMDRYTDYKKVQKEGLFSIFDTDYALSKQKRGELRKQYYTKHKK